MRPLAVHGLGGVLTFLVACGDGAPSGNPTSSGGAGGVSGVGGSAGETAGAGGTGGGGGTGGAGMGGGAGDQQPPPTAGTGGAGGGGGSGSAALSFETDIWPVFNQVRNPPWKYYGSGSYAGCTTNGVCHGGTSPGAGLRMTAHDVAYRSLIDVASVSGLCAGTIRVSAGDPDGSCLVRFYEGRLRTELGWVDQAEIDLVRRWIAQGARP